MEKFQRFPTQKTPRMDFDPDTGEMAIEGHSFPENSLELYEPAMEWVSDFLHRSSVPIHLTVKLIYFNSSSAALLFNLIELIVRGSDDSRENKISWYYEKDDPDIMKAGESFNQLLETDAITMIEYEDDEDDDDRFF